jgi:hypothetical protein
MREQPLTKQQDNKGLSLSITELISPVYPCKNDATTYLLINKGYCAPAQPSVEATIG